MITHVVMWKLKDNAEGAGKHENASKIKAQLEALRLRIGEIRQIEVGVNTVESQDAYDVVLVSVFNSAADLKTYQNHPEHIRAADFIGRVRLDRRFVDYESP